MGKMMKIGIMIAFKAKLKIFQNVNKDLYAHLKTELLTKANGITNKDMDMEPKFGLMVQNMKDIGKMIKHMVLGHLTTFQEINMKENGKEIYSMVKASS